MTRSCFCSLLCAMILGVGGLLPGGALPAAAAGITNTRSATVFATVREAVDAAAAGDTLQLPAGVFTAAGITLSKDLTLRGAGASLTLLQAAETAYTAGDRLFWVTNAQVLMEDLTLRHGSATSSGGAVGCIQGSARLNRCVLTRNQVVISGAATLEAGGGAAFGCALYNCLLVSNEVRAASPVTRPQRCVPCHSRGWFVDLCTYGCTTTCGDCEGSGLQNRCYACGGRSRWTTDGCQTCNGLGLDASAQCTDCEGWGRLRSGVLCNTCRGSGIWTDGACVRSSWDGHSGGLCSGCFGTGVRDYSRCQTCQGRGDWIYVRYSTGRDFVCDVCNGSGQTGGYSQWVSTSSGYTTALGLYSGNHTTYGNVYVTPPSTCRICDGQGIIHQSWSRDMTACGHCAGSGMTRALGGPDAWGGAAWRCTLVNCTVADNFATTPAGGAAVGGAADCRVTNSVIWFNGTNHIRCVLQAVSTPSGNGTGINTRDPLFVNRTESNYRLAPFSPCIDRGISPAASAPADLDGAPRPAGASADLGAYEYHPSGPPGFLLSATNLVVYENGGKFTLSVLLSGMPQNPVVLTVSNLTPAEITAEPASLTFTPATAPSPQALVVTGVNDFVIPVHTGLVSVAVDTALSDPAWSAVPAQLIQVTCVNDDAPPAAPAAVSASDGLYTNKIRVAWNPSTGAELYRVFRNSSNSASTALLAGISTLPSFDDTPVPRGALYYWIQASNVAGLGALSASDTGWRLPMLPPSPAPLTAALPAPGQVQLSWSNPPVPGVQFQLDRRLAGSSAWLALAILDSNVLSYADRAVTNGQSWDYRVCAFNAEGPSAFATALAVALAPPVITSTNRAQATAGFLFSYQITARNSVSLFLAAGLPPGLSLDPAAGLISGYPEQGGTFVVNAGASNIVGTGLLALTLDFAKQTQSITFPQPPNVQVGDSSVRLAPRASSSLPVTLAVISGPASIAGSLVIFTNRGAVTLRASQPGNNIVLPAPDVVRTFLVDRRSQTLSFPPIADRLQGGPPLGLAPVASSGLPVSLVQSAGGGVLAGSLYSPRDEGLVTLTASQPGNAAYEPAPEISRTFRVLGKTWQRISAPTTQDLVRVLFDGAQFTAFGTNLLLRSPDGITWTALTGTNTWPLRGKGLSRVTSPVFGNGTFLAAGQIANSCREPLFESAFYTAPDAASFSPGPRLLLDPAAAAFGQGRFLVLGARWQMPESGCIPVSAADWAALSPNGRDWTESALPPAPASARWQRLFFAGNSFFAWDSQSSRMILSTNGELWQGPFATGFTPDDLAFGNGLWAGVQARPAPALAVSADGLQWTAAALQPPFPLSGIAFGLNTFVAVGGGVWAGDGASWVAEASSLTLNSVAFGDRRFIAAGPGGAVYLSYHPPARSGELPQLPSDLHLEGILSTPFAFQVCVSNPPALYAAQGLPAGLSIDSSSGLVSGAPLETGPFTITLRAANPAGVSSVSLDLLVTASLPGLPEILAGPASQTVILGAPAFFQVVGRGLPGFQYQWFHDGTPLPGAVFSSLSLPGASAADAGQYWVDLSHTNGTTTSARALLEILMPPSLAAAPASTQVPPGGTAVFAVQAAGASPVTCQWRFNGANLPGETGTNLVLTAVDDRLLGAYDVVLSNAAGRLTSAPPAVLAFGGPPVVLSPPAGLEVYAGRPALLHVEARGALPITFEWRRNGGVVPGAAGPSLAFSSAREEDAGDYEAVAINAFGTVTSRPPARLNVITAPRILVAPASLGVAYGSPATFQVIATSSIPCTCQWRLNGTNLSGATQSTLALTNVQLASAGNYTVLLSNAAGVTLSDPPALLSFAGIATILSPPQPAEVLQDRPAAFQVLAVGTLPLQFQWMRDGAALPGATNASLLIPAARAVDTGLYAVSVRNSSGTVTSQPPARLNVILAPAFQSLPATAAFLAGSAATLSASATSAIAFTWQWQANGTNIPGATQSSLVISNIQPAAAGLYTVVAASTAGASTSAPPAALICVIPPAALTVMAGEPVALPCGITSPIPLDLQWRRDGAAIPDQHSPALALAAARPADAGELTLALSNGAALLLTTPPARLSVGSWGDPALEGAVRQALGIGSGVLAYSNLLSLQYLSAGGLGITSLAGLEFAANLSSLYLYANAISDLAPLSGLARLAYLNLSKNRVTGLAPLAGLANLTMLDLDQNRISDLTPLAGLQKLDWLYLGDNQVASLAPLSGLIALRTLSAPRNAITGIACLTPLIRLETLDLSSNPLGDITPLASLAALQTLDLSGVGLLSLAPLASLSKLDYLRVRDNWITDLTPLAGLARLRALDASQNGLSLPPGSVNALIVDSIRNRGGWVQLEPSKSMPAITAGPKDQLLNTGGVALFQVAAVGRGTLRYQWRFNDLDLPGATSTSLSFSNIQPALAGLYSVQVLDDQGAILSDPPARLQVVATGLPRITTPPASQRVGASFAARFQATAAGTLPLSFEWWHDGTRVPGQDSPVLTLPSVNRADAGAYWVVVRNSLGAATSAPPAVLSVEGSTVIAWGNNDHGQTNVPAGLGDTIALVGGYSSSAALSASGNWVFWGDTTQFPPTGSNWTGLAPGYDSALGLQADGTVVDPANPAAPTNVLQIASNPSLETSLALKADGTVAAWGLNNFDQLSIPPGLEGVVSIAAAEGHFLALKHDGTVAAWGYNSAGQCDVPPEASNVVQIAAHYGSSFALRQDGLVVKWGEHGTRVLSELGNVARISARGYGCLALRTDGAVTIYNGFPPALSNAVLIAAGGSHNLALLSPAMAPVVFPQPRGAVVAPGRPVLFQSDAAGSLPLARQWQRDGTNIPGATHPWLYLPSPAPEDSGVYTFTASNAFGSVSSGGARLLVDLSLAAPVFTRVPAPQSAREDESVTFVTEVSGALPLHSQWLLNGAPIAGATNLAWRVNPVQTSNAGLYSIIVSNTHGAIASGAVLLTVLPGYARALDTSNLVWSASGDALWFAQFTLSHDGVDAAQFAVSPDAENSGMATLATTLSGPGLLTFWSRSEIPYYGALRLQLDNAYPYAMEWRDTCDWTRAALYVPAGARQVTWEAFGAPGTTILLDEVRFQPGQPAPVFTGIPASALTAESGSVLFKAAAAGAPPLAYQWQLNGASISGATNASLLLSNLLASQAGAYRVIVSNPSGAITSSPPATLSLIPNQLVTIPDPALETLIRSTLYRPSGPLMTLDLLQLTRLGSPYNYSGMIRSLSGLEAAINLTNALLLGAQVTNLAPLASLPRLQSLSLANNGLTSIPGLDILTNLASLDLGDNPLATLASLSNLASLRSLRLSSCPAPDLTPLACLTNLVSLELTRCQATNLSPLGSLANLAVLNASYTRITTLAPLSALRTLTNLAADAAGLADITPLHPLTNLSILSLGFNDIANLSALSNLWRLRELYLVDNQIASIAPLAGLTNLHHLWLSQNPCAHLAALAGMTRLEYLSIDNTGCSDLSPLATLTNLHSLSANENSITDIGPLASLRSLNVIDLSGNLITNTGSLSGLAGFYSLSLADNRIADIAPLATLSNGYHYDYASVDLARNDLDVAPGSPASGVIAQLNSWVHDLRYLPQNARPSFTNPPAPLVLPELAATTLDPGVSALPAAALQWFLDGFPIPQATNATLPLSSLSFAHAGQYQLLASNRLGARLSPPIALAVVPGAPVPDPLFDLAGWAWITSASPWTLQTNVSHDGRAAWRSAPVDRDSQSVLQTTLDGPGLLSFWCRTDFALSWWGSLQIYAGDQLLTNLAGAREWTRLSLLLPSGSQPVRWVYSGGYLPDVDAAFIDEVAFAPHFGPAILAQAPGQSAPSGSTVLMAASVTGTAPLAFQWFRDGLPLANDGRVSGAASSNLVIANTQDSDAGLYTLSVSNAYARVLSTPPAGLVVTPPLPAITSSPRSQTAAPGASASFSASATGPEPLAWRWYKDGAALFDGSRVAGSASPDLALNNLEMSDQGAYTAVVTGSSGSATSAPAILTIIIPPPPAITSSPRSQTAAPGSSAGFSASATGPEPLAWRWYKDGAALFDGSRVAGAASPDLALSNLEMSDQGAYTAVVTGSSGSATSAPAILTISTVTPSVRSRVLAWGSSYSGQTNVPPGLTNAVAVKGGISFSMALRSDGVVAVWGDNYYGQTNIPAGLSNVAAIAAGLSGECLALDRNGLVTAWGGNAYGQRVVPPGLSNVVAISAGEGHCLALKADGTVVAWGNNADAQCSIPAGLDSVAGIAAGYRFSLALKSDGTVVKWGTGGGTLPASLTNVIEISAGELFGVARCRDGRVLQWNTYYPMPAEAVNLLCLGSGAKHVLAVRSNGALLAWGDSFSGKTALPAEATNLLSVAGGYSQSLAVVGEPDIPQAVILPGSVTFSEGQACFLHARIVSPAPVSCQWQRNGTDIPGATNPVLCLPSVQPADRGVYTVVVRNSQGSAVSPGVSLTTRTAPAILALSATARSFQGGAATFSVQAVGNGPLACQWQFNGMDLADSATVSGATSPVLVLRSLCPARSGAYRVRVASPGGAVLSGEAPLVVLNTAAWGYNASGQSTVPADATNLTALAGGYSFSLGLRPDGSVAGWGFVGSGPSRWFNVRQITAGNSDALAVRADGALLRDNVTAPPAGPTNFTAVAAGLSGEYLALTLEGSVVAWGSSTNGQTNVPAGLGRVTAVAAGKGHCLALLEDGSVVAWGRTNYSLSNIPPQATNAAAIAAGADFNMILRRDGKVFVWGDNWNLQTNVPPSATNIVAIAAGYSHCLALRGNGTVVAWGDNWFNQAVVPAGLSNVVAISAGYSHSLAIVSNNCSAAGLPPLILSQPASLSLLAGQPALFSVAASGDAPLAFQWRLNTQPVPGATNASYRIPAAQTADAGNYSVFVSNPAGSVLSSNAALTVRLPDPMRFGAGPGGLFLLNGALQARLTGSPGAPVLLETSDDLLSWQPFATNAIPEGGWLFSLPVDARPARFLRARPHTQ